jgi:hypothetical protein
MPPFYVGLFWYGYRLPGRWWTVYLFFIIAGYIICEVLVGKTDLYWLGYLVFGFLGTSWWYMRCFCRLLYYGGRYYEVDVSEFEVSGELCVGRPCGICDGQTDTGTGFSPSSFHRGSPCSYITWGMDDRLVGGRSSETCVSPCTWTTTRWLGGLRIHRCVLG